VSDELHEAVVMATPEDVASRVAGVPLLVRTILVLQRAGFERGRVSIGFDADRAIRSLNCHHYCHWPAPPGEPPNAPATAAEVPRIRATIFWEGG